MVAKHILLCLICASLLSTRVLLTLRLEMTMWPGKEGRSCVAWVPLCKSELYFWMLYAHHQTSPGG